MRHLVIDKLLTNGLAYRHATVIGGECHHGGQLLAEGMEMLTRSIVRPIREFYER